MKSITKIVLALLLSFMIFSCDNTEEPQRALTYLALGDSYTIGESVLENDRWPVQLTDTLNNLGLAVLPPKIIAQTGWRTDQLKDSMKIDPGRFRKYDLVTLLIGVNNQVQNQSIENFEVEFKALLQESINLADGIKSHVFVLSIPDYGKTPFGIYLGGDAISAEVDAFNAICEKVCETFEIRFINITPISREIINDASLLGSDNFHPSGKMYKRWVDLMVSEVYSALEP